MRRRKPWLLPVVSLLVSLLLCGSFALSATAETASFSAKVVSDASGNAYNTTAGRIHKYTITTGTYTGRLAYCIHHGVQWDSNKTLEEFAEGVSSDYWKKLEKEGKDRLLKDLMVHSYPLLSMTELGMPSNDAKYEGDCIAATQVIVWEVTGGLRNADGSIRDYTLYNQFIAGRPYAEIAYRNIDSALYRHNMQPDWNDTTVTLKWNVQKNRYEATLSSFLLPDYKTVYDNVPASLHIERSGMTMTLWSTAPVNTTSAIRFYKNFKTTDDSNMPQMAVLAKNGNNNAQELLVPGVLADPVRSRLNVTTEAGSVNLVKTSEDGKVDGFTFKFTAATGASYTAATANGGKISLTLPAGKYTVQEELTAEQKLTYKTPAAQTVTVPSGGTVAVTFHNMPQDGTLEVHKVDYPYGQVEGVPFRIESAATSATNDGLYHWVAFGQTDQNGVMQVTSDTVTAYYKDYVKAYALTAASADTQYTTASTAMYREMYGTNTAISGSVRLAEAVTKC